MITIRILFVCIVGTLLHFLYEWSHHNKLVAIFAAVNESVWEHIKIGMTPTLVLAVYDFTMASRGANVIDAECIALFAFIVLIPLLFYSYTAFTKRSILTVDISCFCFTAAISQLLLRYVMTKPQMDKTLSIVLFCGELLVYLLLTYRPFHLPLFADPRNDKYGLEGHECEHHHDDEHVNHNHKEHE